MDAGLALEAAVLEALSRAEAGERITDAWLRRTFPRRWRAVRDLLRVHAGLCAGTPTRSVLGPYRILQVLGEGATGTVHLAEVVEERANLRRGTRVALKVVHPHVVAQTGFLERALREARVGAEVTHPNVVPTLEVAVADDEHGVALYLVHEYVEGQNLRALLFESRRVPEDLCRRVARDVLEALRAIHGAGFVHRDLKPENILLARDGRVRVTDLGSARALDLADPLTRIGGFVGSLPYAAPEQVFRPAETGARADLYSLGVVLFELLAGVHPYAGTCSGDDGAAASVRPCRRSRRALRLADAPALPTSITPFLRAFVATLMAHEPSERFQTAADALDALEAGDASRLPTAGDLSTEAPVRTAPQHASSFVGRDAVLARLLVAAQAAARGQGSVVLVEGESGAGKSRLLDELGARLRVAGSFRIVSVGLEEDVPQGSDADPCVEGVRSALQASGSIDGRIRRGFERRAGANGRAADAPAGCVAATTFALAALARELPLVLLIDDLHEASPQSRSHVETWIRRLVRRPVLVVATAGRAPAVPDAYPRRGAAGRVSLGRLDASDERRLLALLLGSEAEGEHVHAAIGDRTEGLPGLVVAFVESLRDEGHLVRAADGTWTARGDLRAAPLPGRVRAAVARRLERLDAADRVLLDLAACAGLEVDANLLADATGRNSLDVLRQLARIESVTGLVRSAGARRVFEGRISLETLALSVSGSAASRHHAALAVALERRAAASPGSASVALEVLVHAVRAGDAPRVARWLDPALAHLELSLHAAEAAGLLRSALALPGAVPADRRLRVLLGLARLLGLCSRGAEQFAVLREADDLVRGDPRAAALVLAETAGVLARTGELARAVEVAESALVHARSAGDDEALERALSALGRALTGLNRGSEAVVRHEEQLEIARRSGDARREVAAEEDLGAAHEVECDVDRSIEHLGRALAIVRRIPDAGAAAGNVRVQLAHTLALAAREPEAVPLLHEQIRISRRSGDLRGLARAEVLLADLVACAGRVAEALRTGDRVVRDSARFGDPQLAEMVLRRHARLLVHAGRTADAIDRCRESRAIAEPLGDRIALLLGHCTESLASWTVGAHHEAAESASAAVEIARLLPQHRARFLALLARARCGRGGDGESADFQEALAAAREAREPRAIAQVLVESGLARTEGTDPAAADELLEALALGRSQRNVAVVPRAAARLASIGILAADVAREECATYGAGLSVSARLEVEFDLWRATADRAHADAAISLLECLRLGAPATRQHGVAQANGIRRAVAGLARTMHQGSRGNGVQCE